MVQFLKSKAEQGGAPEQAPVAVETPDRIVEKPHGAVEAPSVEPPKAQRATTAALPEPSASSAPIKDPALLELEGILAEGLGELYGKMLPSERAAFKKKGEEVAQKIKAMIDSAKLKVHKVLALIRDWLRMIPGVTRFFLEQEAKIKTDRIMEHMERKNDK